MHWMSDWPVPFPLFVGEASGNHITDADGHGYLDFCLGDTGKDRRPSLAGVLFFGETEFMRLKEVRTPGTG